jgi:tetratricopeptide (TPR) repeat protein
LHKPSRYFRGAQQPSHKVYWHNIWRLVIACLCLAFTISGCVQIVPGSPAPGPEILKGRDELKRNQVSQAKALFDTAINKDRTNRFTYLYVMQVSLESSHPDLVTEYFRRAESALMKTKGEDRARFFVTASAFLESAGEHGESIRACEEAYRLLPNDPETQNALGYAYAQSGRNLERAIELTTAAIKAAREVHVPDRDLGAIVDSLGWAYYRNDQLAEAIRTLASAADLAPDQPEIQYHLGVAYYDAGKYSDAKITLTRAKAASHVKTADVVAQSKLQNAVEQHLKEVEEKLRVSRPSPQKDQAPVPDP